MQELTLKLRPLLPVECCLIQHKIIDFWHNLATFLPTFVMTMFNPTWMLEFGTQSVEADSTFTSIPLTVPEWRGSRMENKMPIFQTLNLNPKSKR